MDTTESSYIPTTDDSDELAVTDADHKQNHEKEALLQTPELDLQGDVSNCSHGNGEDKQADEPKHSSSNDVHNQSSVADEQHSSEPITTNISLESSPDAPKEETTSSTTETEVDSAVDTPETENTEVDSVIESQATENTEADLAVEDTPETENTEVDSVLESQAIETEGDSTVDTQATEETEAEKSEEDKWMFILGHDKLKKRILVNGKDVMSRPQHGQVVTVSYSAKLDSGAEVDNHEHCTITLGDGDVTQALELCIALMFLNEVCELVTDAQYAYGVKGREPDIPPNASLTYTVQLLVVEDAPVYSEMPLHLRIQHGDKKREKGNEHYSSGDYSAAISLYTKALSILDDKNESHTEGAEELQNLLDTRVKCYNNLSAAQLKVEAWDAAIKSSDEVLKVQSENVKALFRKGKCLAGKGELEAAIKYLKKALTLEPQTKIIHQELSRLMAKHKGEEASVKAMYQKMLGTDKPSLAKKKKQASSSWLWMFAGGATLAAVLSVGIGAYRYLHFQ